MPGLDNNAMIEAIAAQAQGRTPDAAPPQGAPPAPPPAPKADPAPTDIERAQAKVSPNDPSKQEPSQDAEIFRVGDRDFTKAQIMGTHQRYADLNHKWAQNKPVTDVVAKLMEEASKNGYQAKPDEIAALIEASVRAFTKDPQMGGQGKEPAATKGAAKEPMSAGSDDIGDAGDDAMYSAWERDNAVKLPPGFKETAANSKAMGAKMDQMMQMFQQIMQGGMAGQNATQQAQQTMQQAQGAQANAATTMITNNLTTAFQKTGLALDDATKGDFRTFAAARGYDFPDFMDAGLTATVVADYQANKDAPEVARYREILSKRQPYTEVGSSSNVGGGAPQNAGGDQMLKGMIDSAMAKRSM